MQNSLARKTFWTKSLHCGNCTHMCLESRFPSLNDLRKKARRRIPSFVWAYLDSGTGSETTLQRNRTMLDRVLFTPSILHGEVQPDLSSPLLGKTYDVPFGIAPVGMSGLMWPNAEAHLSRAATSANIPYSLSTVATKTPETIGPHLNGNGWFQLYPPRSVDTRLDMLARARDTGFDTLVLTVDVPVASRRERQVRGGLTNPPRLTPRLIGQAAICPAWTLGMLRNGALPRMETLDKYADGSQPRNPTEHIGYLLRTAPDWDYLQWLRDHWDGTLIVKGVMNPNDAPKLAKAGVDALWVSNHAGRQFDGARSAIEVLPAIRAKTDLPLIFDSGIESGLDILRAIAFGADFVMLGRAFHFALAAIGPDGPAHLINVLRKDMIANLGQLGAARPVDLRDHAFWESAAAQNDQLCDH